MNIYDIASEAGTSISTVSRVLNQKGNVNPEIKKRVEEVLKKHNYKPSAIARGMVSKTMKSIAVLTVDLRVSQYARMIYIIEQEFREQGYDVTVCNTGGSIEECDKYIARLSEKKADGLVLIGSIFNELIHYPDITARMKGIPVVIANGSIPLADFYSVLVDDRNAVAEAVEELFQQGNKEIIYIFDMETDSGLAKRHGFLEAMKRHGISDAEKNIITCPHGLEGGVEAALSLLKNKVRFTGIICGEDITAIGVMKGLRKEGLKAGEDYAIIGYNNSPYSSICDPELTTIDNKPELLGYTCAHLLQDILEGKESRTKNVICPELIKRKTTTCKKKSSDT